MTEPTPLPLLTVRTDATHPHYTPLSDSQHQALEKICARLNDKGKHGNGSSFGMDEFTDLLRKGLGNDMLYIACRSTPENPKGFPKFARRILIESRAIDPELKGAENKTMLQMVEDCSHDGFAFHNVSTLMHEHIAAKRPAQLVDLTPPAAASAATTVREEPVAPVVTAKPAGLYVKGSIVGAARIHMQEARAEAATTPLRPLSEGAQRALDTSLAEQRKR